MKEILVKKVIKKGEVYKVLCQKGNEYNLIVNCHDCEQFKGYDKKENIVRCERL
jgi:hypothetical protein